MSGTTLRLQQQDPLSARTVSRRDRIRREKIMGEDTRTSLPSFTPTEEIPAISPAQKKCYWLNFFLKESQCILTFLHPSGEYFQVKAVHQIDDEWLEVVFFDFLGQVARVKLHWFQKFEFFLGHNK